MKTIFTLNKLSMDFYNAFLEDIYPKIEHKPSRPYLVMIIVIEKNRFALPLRTNIRHNYCYKFKNTGHNTESSTGIDFTKAVVITNEKYVGDEAMIDNKEYVELMNKFYFVIAKFKRYLAGYIKFCRNGGDLFVARRYQFTTLKYFKKELGIRE